MAIKTLRVFAEYTSTGFVPMPTAAGIDYGYTLANTFPSTQPSTFQTDDPDLDVTVTAMTDFYVWIRISGTAWNPSYTRNVRVYPDSPDINNVVMNMIIATGPAGVSAYTQIVQTANRLYFNGATTDSVYNSKFAGKTYINELNFGTAPQLATVATSGAYADLTGKPALATVATSGSYADLSSKPSGTAPISYNSGTNSFQITQANSTTNGFLTSTDWNTFNNKYLLPSGGTTAQYLRGDGTLATFPTTLDSTRLILNGRNTTGTTLTKGTVVYINGVQGNTPLFARAIASADSTSAQTLGVVEFDIPNNSNGVVVLVGAVNNLDTSSYTEGVQLYLSGTVAGAFTSSKILAPTHLVYVGIVTRAHPTLGVIEVKIQNGYELDEIHDVQISSPADKHILYYDNATTLWKHSSVTSVLGFTPYNATNPSNYIALTALSASAPLSYNNTTGAFSIAQANGSTNGFLSSTDWTTFNSKQNALTLGNVSEVSSNVLMFPDGTAGKTIGNLSIQVVQAGASTNGFLSSADWTTFNNKQNALTLTTTGTSGAATLSGATLNIPQYQTALTNPITGTGTTNTLPKFTGTSALGNSNITDNGTSVSIGGTGNVNINNFIGGSFSRVLPTGNTSAGQTINLTRTDNTSGLINRTQFNYNEDGFSGGGASQEINSNINRSTNQSGEYTNLALTTFQSGSGSISDITTLGVVMAAGGGTGAVTNVNFIRGRTGPGTQNYPITNLTYINFNNPLTGTITNYRGINIGDFTGTTLSRALDLNLSAGTGKWNIFAGGTANNYMAGSLGIGTTSLTSSNLSINKNITGSAFPTSVLIQGAAQSDATSLVIYVGAYSSTQATTFTIPNLRIFNAAQGTFGAGSTVTNQYGFNADATLIGATNNYGFRGAIAAGTGRWNIYMDGTASNYLAGTLSIGTTATNLGNLAVFRNITGLTAAVYQGGTIQSDITASSSGFRNDLATQATAFTLTNYYHFFANQGTIGAGSVVTNQNGFIVGSGLTGATNNYGFRGLIPSGTGRWNLYMDGTAQNYLAGNLGIGSGKTVPTYALDVAGDININSGQSYRIGGTTYTVASTSTSGFLSSTDWNTFNNKASAFSGTTNYIPKFTSSSAIGNSQIFDNGTAVGIGVIPSAWASGTFPRVLQVGNASLVTNNAAFAQITNNMFFDGTSYKYITTNGASRIIFESGDITFNNVGSGTAGNTASTVERMRITSAGNAEFSGQIKTTFSGQSISINAAGTGSVRMQLQNNNIGNSIVAVEDSVGGSQFSGTTAYSMAIGTATARNFFIGTDGAARLTVTSGGNVGIGTTNPTVFGGGMEIQRSSQAALRASTTTGTLVGGAEFGYEGSDGGYIQTVQANGRFTFYMGNASVLTMRLTSGGNTLLGTSVDNGERLYVSGSIRATGNITANSDLTLKKNLKLIENPAEKLMSLNGYSYQWKENDEYQYGVIAQEVEKVMSYAVQTGNNGIKGVAYNQLTPLLIEGFKLHNQKIDLNTSRITQLENEVQYLKAKLA